MFAPAPPPVRSHRRTGVEGVVAGGIAVQRGVDHVRTIVEDCLGTVAMVEIDVDNSNAAGALIPEPLGCDGGVVQIASAAEYRCGDVVTRRTTEGEGKSLPFTTCSAAVRPRLPSRVPRTTCRGRCQ